MRPEAGRPSPGRATAGAGRAAGLGWPSWHGVARLGEASANVAARTTWFPGRVERPSILCPAALRLPNALRARPLGSRIPWETHGPLQLLHKRAHGEDRLLRPRPVREDDEPAVDPREAAHQDKGKMLSLATETDRTLFFDFLPIELGTIRGMQTRVQLYTVPGRSTTTRPAARAEGRRLHRLRGRLAGPKLEANARSDREPPREPGRTSRPRQHPDRHPVQQARPAQRAPIADLNKVLNTRGLAFTSSGRRSRGSASRRP